MQPIKFTIDLEPVTKKNHQRIVYNKKTGRPMVIPSQQYKDYEYAAGFFIPGKGTKIDEPVNIKASYYVGTRRKVDIANLHECLHDVLVKYELLKDDDMKIIVSTDGSRVRYDKERPRTEVEITPASPEDVEEARKFKVKK